MKPAGDGYDTTFNLALDLPNAEGARPDGGRG